MRRPGGAQPDSWFRGAAHLWGPSRGERCAAQTLAGLGGSYNNTLSDCSLTSLHNAGAFAT